LIFQFPNSTLLHEAFLAFLAVGVANRAFAVAVAWFYLPPALHSADNSDNRLMRACSLMILELFAKAQRKNPELKRLIREDMPELMGFIKGPLKVYRSKTKAAYGGGMSALAQKIASLLD
jgi:hypothetical protein